MRRAALLLPVIFLFTSLAWAQSVGPSKVIYPTKVDTSPPLRDLLQPVPNWTPGIGPREIPNMPSIYEGLGSGYSGPDPIVQNFQGPRPAGSALVNFEGQSNSENPGLVSPPDTNGDVGPNHYVQMINLILSIYDKSGTRLPGYPVLNNVLWTGFGTNCEFQNAGDPIVLYDPLADRWLFSQFTSPGGGGATECFAVSTTPDPTGPYHRFEFPTPGNDYPKFSVWSDGGGQSAYLGGIRNFSGPFNFDAYAFERDKMLAGDNTAALAVFNMSSLLPGITNFLPSDIDGTTPAPAGSPGIFVGMENPSIPQNELEMFELEVDWANIGNSTLTLLTPIPVAQFNGNVCNFARNCIPQPNTGQGVDGFADAMMHRLAYRNFGTHESLVCSHTVDVGNFPDHAGIRWHELRRTGPPEAGQQQWTLRQEGTFSPDNDHRWMPSIAMNSAGDIVVGYSVSSNTTFPSIRFAGRLGSDPPNGIMTLGEGVIIDGGGSQTGSDRWGDYSMMAVDPSDDLTFWFTNEYYQTTSARGWRTRIASLSTAPQPPTITSTPNTNATVNQPYSYDVDNTVNVTGTPPITFTFTGPVGFNVDANTGVVSWTPTAGQVGLHAISITATNNEGSDIQNFNINVTTSSVIITTAPVNPPVVIPPGGGSFNLTAMIDVLSGVQTFDIWNLMTAPGGQTFTTVGPVTVNLAAGTYGPVNLTQSIPGGVPAGSYGYAFNVGTFPNTVINSSSFTWTKSATSSVVAKVSPAEGADGWSVADAETGQPIDWSTLAAKSDDQVGLAAVPEGVILQHNYPNPFNPSTLIRYSLSEAASVRVRIYNTLGQEVATLVDEFQTAGAKSVVWNGRDNLGQTVSAGTYLYKLEAGNVVRVNKMVFLK